MKNSYLVALTGSGGTVPPELGVVRRLVERGHRVTVLAEDSMAAAVAATGARLRIRAGAGFARETVDEIDSAAPDMVLASYFAFGAMVAAQSRGVPFSVLMPGIYPLPVEGSPPPGSGFTRAQGPLGRARDNLVGGLVQRRWDQELLPQLNALRADFDLERLAHYRDQVQLAHRQLVLSSEAFDFPAPWPDGVRFTGPILDDPHWTRDTEWTVPDGGAPVILVSLSSTDQRQTDCLQRIADALGRLPVRGVITTGPAVHPTALTAPANVSVLPAAPHLPIMRHASLVITHGGHGTLMKSFAADLPVLVLPHGRDQADNAARVRAHNAGITLPRTASPHRITRAVQRLLTSPAHYRAAARLGRTIRQDATSDRLMRELDPAGDHPGVISERLFPVREFES
ncbi:glycosyltransferase [Nocardia huaxiensis]|uniref:Glycosyltransferase family 1 protein n=1 Tax=Nocardia huaxiensis TaxID=2755382 RepID=A0A7D6VC41_9NOCA|nr:glycosyltransferase [Nocardia huaxiensis]QLY31531.1 glycosyltransferase family 1 protein [Nocardia huaxiensis]UFS95082.1 glycosyltransferase [Nocardia huaxiensis]